MLTLLCNAQFYHQHPEAIPSFSWKGKCTDGATLAAKEPCPEVWPTSGWSDQPDILPVVTTPVILAHLLQTGKAMSRDTVQLTQKSLERGHDFFFGGYVHDVKVCKAGAKFYVQSKCWASQHEHMEYAQRVVLSEVQQSDDPGMEE